MSTFRHPPGHPIQLITGLTLWFVWLCLVYGGAAVACAVAPPPPQAGPWNWVNGTLLLVSAVFALGFAVAAWRSVRFFKALPGNEPTATRRRFFASAAAVLHGVAAVSTVVVALPLVVLAPCG
ncbi:MAG: hypothetical protein ACK4OE_21055 [Acidovorax sp.]|uniref:hypothetical protein n=1 Tax=Acidovorax sp. TaxID=1872122 RepID=UPI003919034A